MIPFSFLAGLSWFLKHRLVFPLKPQTAAPSQKHSTPLGGVQVRKRRSSLCFPLCPANPIPVIAQPPSQSPSESLNVRLWIGLGVYVYHLKEFNLDQMSDGVGPFGDSNSGSKIFRLSQMDLIYFTNISRFKQFPLVNWVKIWLTQAEMIQDVEIGTRGDANYPRQYQFGWNFQRNCSEA